MEVSVLFKFKYKKDKQSHRKEHKNILIRLAPLVMAFITLSPTIIQASHAYFLSFTLNPGARAIVATTSLSDVGSGFEKHAEIATGDYYLYNSDDKLQFRMNDNYAGFKEKSPVININVPNTLDASEGKKIGFDKRFAEKNTKYKNKEYQYTLPYSFPGVHAGTGKSWKGRDADEARQATHQDELQANFVGEHLTSGFNRLLSIAFNAEYPNSNKASAEDLFRVAQKLADLPVSDAGYQTFGEGTPHKVTISVEDANLKEVNNNPYINPEFYKTFTIGSVIDKVDQSITLPIAVNKGYDDSPDAKMYDTIKGTPYHTSGKHMNDVYAISWENMVMQAGANAAKGVLLSDVDTLNPPGRIESGILNMFNGITTTLRSMLGLNSITDLIFNQGVIKDSFASGAIPKSMVPVVNFVFSLTRLIAILIGIGSLLSLIIKSNLSVMNPQMRVDIKDGFMTIIGAMFILVLFTPVWNGLLELNVSFVNLFYALANNPAEFAELFAGGGGRFASFILSVAFIIVEIWFNFFYITRAITIMILYMFAPLMIVAISYGGQHKMIFTNWSKEILGALFIQSIHASVLGVLSIGISRGLASSAMWQYVILISVIPLSDLLRKSVLGLGGDSISSTASSAEKGLMLGGAVGAGLAMKGASVAAGTGISKLAGNSGGSGGGFGGGGSGGGNGSGKNALGDEATDRAIDSVDTGNKNMQVAQEAKANMSLGDKISAGAKDIKDGSLKENLEKGGKALNKVDKTAVRGIKGAAEKLDSDMGKSAIAGLGAVAGGVMTTAMTVGDVATDGGGSGQAARIAGGYISQKGGGKGGGKGGFSRSSSDDYASPEAIANAAPSENDLNELRDKKMIGDDGALTLQQQDDGSQILSSDKETFLSETGYTDVKSYGASEEFENGMTNFTYDSKYINPHNEDLLSNAAQITQRYDNEKNDGQLSDKTAAEYNHMRETTGMANVDIVGENSGGGAIYSIDIDNQALGWHGTSTTDNTFHVQAHAKASKKAPNFNQANAQTHRMNNSFYSKGNQESNQATN